MSAASERLPIPVGRARRISGRLSILQLAAIRSGPETAGTPGSSSGSVARSAWARPKEPSAQTQDPSGHRYRTHAFIDSRRSRRTGLPSHWTTAAMALTAPPPPKVDLAFQASARLRTVILVLRGLFP